MHRVTKTFVIASIALGGTLGLSACSGGLATGIVDLGTSGQGAVTGAKQIDNAQRAVVGETIDNVYMMLERDFALNGVYTPVTSVPGVTTVTSDSGYIIKDTTSTGTTAYRVSGSTKLYWFDTAITDISKLTADGAVIPAGITTLP